MSLRDCISEVQKAAQGALSEDQVGQIVDELVRRQKARAKINKAEALEDSFELVAEEMADEIKMAARIEKRNAAINILKRKSLEEFHDTFPDPAMAIRATNVGVNRHVPGARSSVGANTLSIQQEYIGGFMHDLEQAGLLEFMSRRRGSSGDGQGHIDFEIARELWEIKPGGRPGVSGSKEAKGIADIIHKWQEVSRLRQNRAGAFIRKAPGYITRQAHDQVKVAKAAADEWIGFVRPLLDEELTFKGADPDKFLTGAHAGISTGLHMKAEGGNFHDLAFKGPSNLGKKVSQERILHFKSAEAWYQYNERFGSRSLVESVFQGLTTGSRNIALMETWGPNPRAMFESVLENLKNKHRGNAKASKALGRKSLLHQFDEIEGVTHMTSSIEGAQATQVATAIQSSSKLGFATLSSIADVAAAASELRWQGENLGAAYVNQMKTVLGAFSGHQQKQIGQLLGVGFDSLSGNVIARNFADDALPGLTSDIMRLYFKANLLTPWTESQKRAVALMMSTLNLR